MRKISIISVLLVTAIVLAGCGSSSSEESSQKIKSSSSNAFTVSLNAVEEAQSYKFTANIQTSGNVAGQKTDGQINMRGSNSADGKTSLIVVDLSELFSDASSLGALGLGSQLEIEQRIVDGVAYTKNLDILGTGGDTWSKQDVSELLSSQSVQNPNQYLQYLKASDGDIEEVGNETINGVETTHYKAILSSEIISDYFDSNEWKNYYEEQGLSEDDFSKFKKAYVKGLSDTPIELWVDENDLPVRMKISTKVDANSLTGLTSEEGESKLESIFTIDFSDWGVALDVQAPPADKIITQEEYERRIRDSLLGQLGN